VNIEIMEGRFGGRVVGSVNPAIRRRDRAKVGIVIGGAEKNST
jgi:hypothetical protein